MRRWSLAAAILATVATSLTIPVWHVERGPVATSVTYLPLTGVDAAALAASPAPGEVDTSTADASMQAAAYTAADPAADEHAHGHDHADAVPLEPAVVTAPRETEPFDLVGVVADEPLDPASRIQVRVREGEQWSSWEELPVSDHLPDPGTAEAQRARSTSAPLVASDADAVQVRIDTPDGSVPEGTRLALIDSPTVAADADLQSVPVATADAAAGRPNIITRAQWGADESLVRGTPSFSDTIKVGFVHHVVATNDYTPAQAAAQMRAVYSWFVKGVGVNDFGYNFVVDRFGRIYEGRRGSIEGAVIGAHTSGFNSESFAVSFLGNAETLNPTRAQAKPIIDAYAKVIAWKLSQHHRNPQGSAVLTSAGPGPGQGTTSMYWPGERVRVPAILGHGDIGSTACPGKFLDASLAAIRSAVAARTGPSFFSPAVTGSSWGSTTPLTLRARTNAAIDYEVAIANACGVTVRTLSGSVEANTTFAVDWDGRNGNGKRVPPGTYTYTLTGTSEGVPVTPWTGAGLIASTDTSPPDPCAPPDSFTLTGTGYGHGVGMSQWGALGMAREGSTAGQILRHYYVGTKVEAVEDDVPLRVGLMSKVASVRVRAEAGATMTLSLGTRTVALLDGDIVNFTVRDGRVLATVRSGSEPLRSLGSVRRAGVTWTPPAGKSAADVEVISPGQAFGAGSRYRFGSLEIGVSGTPATLAAVNIVSVHDEYLYGIAEVVPTWPQAALQAQVIASRSYALDAYAAGVRPDCLCHVNDGDAPYYDQTYRGSAVIDGVGGTNWARAVRATAVSPTTGRAVTFEGEPIRAFYTASTAGRTMSAQAVWGGTDYPWAVSVDDSWSLRVPENPYRSWAVTVTRQQLEQVVGVANLMRLRVGARWYTGGTPRTFVAVGQDGTTATVTAAALRAAFGLRSAYITSVRGVTGVDPTPVDRTISLTVSPAAPVAGDDVTLTGTVTPQGAGLAVVRQVRFAGDTAWQNRNSAVTGPSGDFALTIDGSGISAGSTYSWRVVLLNGSTVVTASPIRTVTVGGASGGDPTPVDRTISLTVSPAAPVAGDDVTLTGTVAPQGAGLTVVRQVQFAGDTAWQNRNSAVTGSSGAFTFTIAASGMTRGATYSWRVVILDGTTVVKASPVRTVTVG